MTVTSTTAISGPYDGDDATVTFDYAFYIADTSELRVTLADSDGVETVQTLTTHYAVTRSSETGQGTFTMVTAPATGEIVAATLNVPLTQATNLLNKGAFFAETHETAFDKVTRITQQISESLSRCIRVGVTSGTDPDDVVTGTLVTTSIVNARVPVLLGEATADADAAMEISLSYDLFDSYTMCELELINVRVANDDVSLHIQIYDYDDSAYHTEADQIAMGYGHDEDDASVTWGDAEQTSMQIAHDMGSAQWDSLTGVLLCNDNAADMFTYTGNVTYGNAVSGFNTDFRAVTVAGKAYHVAAWGGLKVYASAGNITSGTIRLWGRPTGS